MHVPEPAILAAYDLGKQAHLGQLSKTAAIKRLQERFGLNTSTARDSVYNVGHILDGKLYHRTNNAFATEHYLKMIHQDFGIAGLAKAVSAVEKHVDYYAKLRTGTRAPGIRAIAKRYRAIVNAASSPVLEQEVAKEADQIDVAGEFDLVDRNDAKDKILRAIARRRGQPAFRKRLLKHYGGRCAISGCGVAEALEAVHIVPYCSAGTYRLSNGLLLRADLHTLFDLGLIAIDVDTMTVLVAPELRNSGYDELAGKTLRVPENPQARPSHEWLREHRRQSRVAE